MANRKFFVGGNWKCNGNLESIHKLVEIFNAAQVVSKAVEVVVAAPNCYLPIVRKELRGDFQVSAQNCWSGPSGAITGEISAEMLRDLDVGWVITGHSERRTLLGESSEFVADKAQYALSQGLGVILCVGETLEEREGGRTLEVVEAQLEAVTAKVADPDWIHGHVVVAYEPLWSIGTGNVATPMQAQEVHSALRTFIGRCVSPAAARETRIIYGGSVTGASSGALAGMPDVDGFLVGGASLRPEFIDIINTGAEDHQGIDGPLPAEGPKLAGSTLEEHLIPLPCNLEPAGAL